MKKFYLVLLLVLVALVATSCTAGPNTFTDVPNEEGELAGFWRGLWHGFIAPFTFLISLFSDSVNVFEVHNTGNWYVFGFLMGASIIFGGSGRGSKRRRRD